MESGLRTCEREEDAVDQTRPKIDRAGEMGIYIIILRRTVRKTAVGWS